MVAPFIRPQEVLQFIKEFTYITKLPVNGSKPYIGHTVKIMEFPHDDLS